ncbi:MAG: AAA family ATPase [Treponema sp.]|nr:AAA family ATPase [Treponema sp.]
MSFESLHIKNFGPLKNINLENITPFTVLVGESGSGKSTIMKVLVLFRYIYKKIVIRSYLRNSGVQKSPFKLEFGVLIKNNGFGSYISADTLIVYKRGEYQIEYRDGKLNLGITVANDDLSLDKMSFISDKRNVIPDILSKTVSVSAKDMYLNETWNDFVEATSDFSAMDIPYLGVSLSKKKTPNGVKFMVLNDARKNDTYEVEFENSSSGMQNVAPLVTILDYFVNRYDLTASFNRAILSSLSDSDMLSKFRPELDIGKIKHKNLFFHIEEPELSLYPSTQTELISQVVHLCFESDAPRFRTFCIITTHSPYVVNYLNLLIKQGRILFENISVYEVLAGNLRSLKNTAHTVIDTSLLSEPISRIYEEYNRL